MVEEKIRKAVENANRMFGEGFRRADATAIGALYTEDTILMPPNFDMMRGRSVCARTRVWSHTQLPRT